MLRLRLWVLAGAASLAACSHTPEKATATTSTAEKAAMKSTQFDKLPPMQGDEKEILQELESYRPRGSRLSCQIPFEAALAGLEVEVAPEE